MLKADNLPPSCAVVTKSGNLNFLEPSVPLHACNGTALPFTGFHYSKLLTYLCMVMAALSVFQAWILMRVSIGKVLIELGARNNLDRKLHCLGACQCLAGCLFHCITVAD